MLDRPEEILYNPRSAGPLAQWLEQATHNRLVAGSSPAGATKQNKELDEKSSDSFFFGRESGDVVGDVSEWLGDVSSVGLNVWLAGCQKPDFLFLKA